MQPYLRFKIPELRLHLAEPHRNADTLIDALSKSELSLQLFPPLALSGVSCGQYALQAAFLDACLAAFDRVLEASRGSKQIFNCGLPYASPYGLLALECLIQSGRILLASCHPLAAPFVSVSRYELSAAGLELSGQKLCFETGLRSQDGFLLCLDLADEVERHWEACPKLICRPVAIEAHRELRNHELARAEQLCYRSASLCLLTSPGSYESSGDFHYRQFRAIVAESAILRESLERLGTPSSELRYDCFDFQLRNRARVLAGQQRPSLETVDFSSQDPELSLAHFAVGQTDNSPLPFVSADGSDLEEVVEAQISGLSRRLDCFSSPELVLGLSGGLDSCISLLAAALCLKRRAQSSKRIHCLRMPGLGSSPSSRSNGEKLAELLDVTNIEISIVDSVRLHLEDLHHPEDLHDLTFENAQARERTQLLMDYSNQVGGLVLGTGDLSEIALGWSTYNGDHMSMFAVNGSIPKTLMPRLARCYAAMLDVEGLSEVVEAILHQAISPELLPLGENQELLQSSEDQLGPYLLHDFFLYHRLREEPAPAELLLLAIDAFSAENRERYAAYGDSPTTQLRPFDEAALRHCLQTFLRRFQTQQFKRACMPEGVVALPLAFSPRRDLIRPGDLGLSSWSQLDA
ncbi:MAG: NAD(+) synthase [Eubacteriales bacterium]|nr:NAD(+) synthase [Eubacteriales bacterium]